MEPKYIVCREDLEHNIRILKEKAKGKLIWGVVKGNGYGLGIGPLVQILNDCGIDHFAVTSLAEAQAVRDAGETVRKEIRANARQPGGYGASGGDSCPAGCSGQGSCGDGHRHGPLWLYVG